MSFIGEQIKKYRNIKGMTQQYIADALGESSGRVIYNWEKGVGRPDCDKLARLCDLLDVSADELIGSKYLIERPTAIEWTMLQKYRDLDDHGKEVVNFLINNEHNRVSTASKKSKPCMYKIRWYTLPASAGSGNILDSDFAEELYVPESPEAEQADYVISVSGDSMEPTYHDGDKVFVEKCDSVNIGEIGIFIVNGDAYIKERGKNKLISHNEKYSHINLNVNDSIYCCGRVIGVVDK